MLILYMNNLQKTIDKTIFVWYNMIQTTNKSGVNEYANGTKHQL